jgi:hypothetical protein
MLHKFPKVGCVDSHRAHSVNWLANTKACITWILLRKYICYFYHWLYIVSPYQKPCHPKNLGQINKKVKWPPLPLFISRIWSLLDYCMLTCTCTCTCTHTCQIEYNDMFFWDKFWITEWHDFWDGVVDFMFRCIWLPGWWHFLINTHVQCFQRRILLSQLLLFYYSYCTFMSYFRCIINMCCSFCL